MPRSAISTARLEILRRLGRFAETGRPLLSLGIVYQKSGEWDRALDYYKQAENVFLQTGNQHGLCALMIGLGNVARLQRRFVDAESSFLGALERARTNDARREEVLALEFLGEMAHDQGRFEDALRRYDEALVLAERLAPKAISSSSWSAAAAKRSARAGGSTTPPRPATVPAAWRDSSTIGSSMP